ncbi:MAG: response regulator, partial [Acidobacteria bacterium]|nr:response regulator [Acidobacteriota bacterium]
MPAPSILIVDDEASICTSLQAILREEGWQADALPSGEECLKAANKNRYDLVLLDVWLQGIDGLEVLRQLKQQEDAPVVIMISGHGTIETAVKATKLGA